MHPAKSFTQPPLADQHPRLQCRDRTHIRRQVAPVHGLGLLEQLERTVQIARGLVDARHGDAPAIPVLRKARVLAQLTAPQQSLHGGIEIVPLAGELAHANVHL
jgi:hypothetical protein